MRSVIYMEFKMATDTESELALRKKQMFDEIATALVALQQDDVSKAVEHLDVATLIGKNTIGEDHASTNSIDDEAIFA